MRLDEPLRTHRFFVSQLVHLFQMLQKLTDEGAAKTVLHLASRLPRAALVGYDRDQAIPPMVTEGFRPVGDLTVWATPN